MIRVAESERDVARWLEIRNTLYPAIAMTPAALAAADRRGPPGRRKLLAEAGGFAIAMPADPETPEPWLTVGVLHPVRRQGIGSALWAAGAVHLASLGVTTVRSLSMDGDADGARFLEGRGFAVAVRQKALERDLSRPLPPAPPPPPGIVLRELEFLPGADLEAVYRLEVETAREIPGEEQVELPPFPDWMEEVAAEGPAPLVLGAFDGDEVVGMALIVFGEVPPGTALHWMTATRRSHRHRGIARALKRASLAAAAARGATTARTFTDLRNAGMRALNEELGYVPAADVLIWSGPCSG